MQADGRPVAIVTGAARNIGFVVARKLSQDYAVVMADIVDATAAAVAVGNGASAFAMDVAEQAQCAALVQAAEALGNLTTVVHCAAVTVPPLKIEEIELSTWKRLIEVNLTGTFNLVQAVIPALRRGARQAADLGTDASVVLVTSRAGKVGFVGVTNEGGATKAHYAASKAGVISLTKSLALELAADGIRVNGIAPGPIEGGMISKDRSAELSRKVPLRRLGTQEDIANAAYFLVRPTAGFITGHVLDVNGGTSMA